MRASIKALAHRLARVRGLSRIVHIVSAIYRLPEIRRDLYLLGRPLDAATPGTAASRQAAPTQSLAESRIAALEIAWRQNFPAALETVAGLNHRMTSFDNAIRSYPFAMREAKRERDALVATSTAAADRLAALEQDRGAEHEIAQAMQRRLDEVDGRIAVNEERAAANATLHEQSKGTLSYLLGRVEFVRRELMFELRYGSGTSKLSTGSGIEPRILNQEKVERLRQGGLRLNLGAGHIPLDGYLNVDLRELPHIDVIADAEHLPFADGELAEIMSAHMLEHFPEEQLKRKLLPYWFRLLAPGGVFRAVVPDAEAMMREYSRGKYPYDELREVFYGGQDYDGDFHYNMFTPGSLQAMLVEAGFTDVEVPVEGRKNGACYEFEIVSMKPGAR